jgi:predicted ATPase
MGIHTGAAQLVTGQGLGVDYSGYLTLTRAQRVMSVAHGGQVLLSGASAELVRDDLPTGGALKDLGEHRLKGLVNLERLWQLIAPDLQAEFPALHSLNSIPNNLPAQTTTLVGREAELADIVKRLSSEGARLLTLTGPGGIGKTRIALQSAAELIDRFRDGVYFVDLAPLRDPVLVPEAIAQTVGLRETGNQLVFDELKDQLRQKKMLLLLDNFEQVTAAAPLVGELLRDCPLLNLLVTSREALHLRGEQVFPLPPLDLPRIDLKLLAIEQFTQFEAVRLFIERAQAVQPDFTVTNENAPAIAEICARLDGLPLAIELAAARTRLLPPKALLERLESRLKLLRGGARDLPARQQTLRDTIEWGYELLDAGEQRLFELLSVFSGGCTLEAVEAVAEGIELFVDLNVDILDGLASLIDKSMLRQVEHTRGAPRLLMLETIREYAAEMLGENPEFREAATRRHAVYFAGFSQLQWSRLTGTEREAALDALSTDLENLRTAWRYWVVEKDPDQLGRLVDSLWLFYDTHGWYHATVNLANDLLEVLTISPPTPERTQEEIAIRISLARALLAVKGYTPEVEEAFTHALEFALAAGKTSQIYPVLRSLFSFYSLRGEFDKGISIGEQILELADLHNEPDMRVDGHTILGASYAFTGNIQVGLEHMDKAIASIDLGRHSASRFRLGIYPGISCYTSSSMILWGLGFPDRALRRTSEAVGVAKKINHPYSLAFALFHTGLLRFWRQEMDLCLGISQAVLDLAREHELLIWSAVGSCLHGVGVASMGRAEEGLAEIDQGMEKYQQLKSPPVFWPLLRSMQAWVCGLAGNPAKGLAYIDEMALPPAQGFSKILVAETFRIRGELLVALSPNNQPEAEQMYLAALQIAQEHEALMLELRIGIRLARLWNKTASHEQSRQLLSQAYARFTEGFSTVDLQEARELLGIS